MTSLEPYLCMWILVAEKRQLILFGQPLLVVCGCIDQNRLWHYRGVNAHLEKFQCIPLMLCSLHIFHLVALFSPCLSFGGAFSIQVILFL